MCMCMYVYMYCLHVHTDGEPGDRVGLLPDGPYPERGETVHLGYLQEDKEGRLQRATHSKVDPQVSSAGHKTS